MPRKGKPPVLTFSAAVRGPIAVRTKTQPAPSGIAGLDAVLHGGFPLGRTTIVVGGPGGGKNGAGDPVFGQRGAAVR